MSYSIIQLFNYSMIQLFNYLIIQLFPSIQYFNLYRGGQFGYVPYYIYDTSSVPRQLWDRVEEGESRKPSPAKKHGIIKQNQVSRLPYPQVLSTLPIHHFIIIPGNASARSKYSSGSIEGNNIEKNLAIPPRLPGHCNTTAHYDSSTQV